MRPSWCVVTAVCLVAAAIGLATGQDAKPPTYTSLGCYRDAGERDLPFFLEARATTVYRCRDQCRQLKYRYSGSQYSDQCLCGNRYGRYGKAVDSACSMRCNALWSQNCGGVWHNQVFTTGVGEAAIAIKTLGCFVDKGERDLPYLSVGPIDVNNCLKRCGTLGYKYAGLQYGSQCWCGTKYGTYGKGADAECSMQCVANRQQLCGGIWHNHIYETGYTPVERESLGCYIDQGIRDMLEIKVDEPISIELCIRYCHELGYKYAGVQYASQCFCGNKFGQYGKGDLCNMPCNGKRDEICGGVWRNSVYATGREPDKFVSLGCYNDRGERDLPFLVFAGAITLNNCRWRCASFGFVYFGVQNGDQCWCGNSYGKYGKADDSQCTRPCIGNKEQICGNAWFSNIYPTNVQAFEGSDSGASAQGASNDQERSLVQNSANENSGTLVTISQIQMRSYGCFKDQGERDLPQMAFVGTLSVHYCRWTCRQLKYRFFGLQAISHCFCGNSFGQYGQGLDSNCNFKCGANNEQTCGGVWFNSVYNTGVTPAEAEQKPLGCYVDRAERDLPLMGAHCPSISINTCIKACSELGYKYAGTQAGSQCFCGNTYGRYGQAKDSECYVRCHANRRQMCGGIWNQHIYETKADITNPEPLGCYKDQGVRDLVELALIGVMSINYCRLLCRDLGYRYAGVQYSSHCFCGNNFGRYGKSDMSQCSMKCTGHHEQLCGGVWHNAIYESGKLPFLFKSLGCYNDKIPRDLPFLAKIGLVNLNNCRQACWRYGFKYFAVQNGDLCHCADKFGQYGKVEDVRCQKRCLGNQAQICGDLWLNSIYETGLGGDNESDYTRETEENKTEQKPNPEPISTVIDGTNDADVSINKETDGDVETTITYKGCYNDKQQDHDLPDRVFTGTVTIQLCVRKCARRNYRYAGLYKGAKCFCGSTFGKHGVASKSSCNIRCRGNNQQFCGGDGFITVYATGVAFRFVSKGCFVDQAARDLPVLAMSGRVSVNRCFKRCRSLGYYYAGVQNAMQCFCGNSYNRYGKGEDAKCNLRCRGNSAQICGGDWFQNIYRTDYKEMSRKVVGCFKDSDDHDLPHEVKSSLMSVNLCIEECSDLGFRYAGLQEGKRCFCGNKYGKFGKGEDTICTSMCSGNANQMCGGSGYNLIFETGATEVGFTNLGCFTDKAAKDLPFLAMKSKASLNSCRLSCLDYGFLYFGVQNGKECWCGNSYGKYGKSDDEGLCNQKCEGNSGEICGGINVQNIYATGLGADTIIISEGISNTESISGEAGFITGGDISGESTTTIISFEYVWTVIGPDAIDQLSFGCYKDSADRDLPTLAVSSASMTPKECVKLCQSKNFHFAGLQNGNECWCGSNFGKYGPASESSCNTPCSGDANKMCGGSWHNFVYTTSIENLQGITTIVLPAPTPQVITKTITITETLPQQVLN